MKRELLKLEDGTVMPHYIAEEGEIAVITGPMGGVITLDDGTHYDVSDPVIGVPEHHHDELVMAIGDQYAEEGHPHLRDDGVEFVHDREATAEACKATREHFNEVSKTSSRKRSSSKES